jgi:hypothetical protein
MLAKFCPPHMYISVLQNALFSDLLIYFMVWRFGRFLLVGRQQRYCHGDRVLCEHYVYYPHLALIRVFLIHSLTRDLWWLFVTVLVDLHHSSVLSVLFLSEAEIRCVKTCWQLSLLIIFVLRLVVIFIILIQTVCLL